MGLLNNQGALQISPFPSVEELVGRCLRMLCDRADPERGFVDFETRGDAVVLLVNNYGGLSNLELGALADEVLSQLGKCVSTGAREYEDRLR